MSDAATLHEQQVAFWNGPGGALWVARQERMDAALAPIAEAVIAHAGVMPDETVLDIGCGAGATTLALAHQVGPRGHVTGLDVSAPLLGLARSRATGMMHLDWVLADASRHAFLPASVDLLFSRFGVMFFGDPVAAFANLRTALRPAGRLVFACWRSFDQNPWMLTPLRAVQTVAPPLPRPGPNDPGPFAFGDPDKVTAVLAGAGFGKPVLTPLDLQLDIAGGEGLESAVQQSLASGPAARVLQDQPEDVVQAAAEAMRAALAPHVDGNSVRLPAAVWLVRGAPA